MNVKKMIAAVAVLAAANSVMAAEWVEFNDFQSTKTRAEVVAELQQAKADGSYAAVNQEYVEPVTAIASGKTRAQVMAELKQSVADGSYAAMHQEYEGQYPALSNAGATRLAGQAGIVNAN